MRQDAFAGSTVLARLILRRDRLRIILWLLCLCGLIIALVPVFENLFATEAERMVMAQMMQNPAMIAIVGPVYGVAEYHTGALYANMMLLFSALAAGIMNIFLVTRHTRQDEEQGRLEMIRSLPVGRLANLSGTMLAALLVNGLIVVITGLGMFLVRGSGMSFTGCLLFAAGIGAAGMFFAGATAFFCQLTANNRSAGAFSFLLLLVSYLLRAAGDMGNEPLSLLSPLGLILRVQAFTKDFIWPLWFVLGSGLVFVFLAFFLCRKRDLGRGLLAEKPGKRHAGRLLASPLGLAVRLLRTSVIVWLFSIFVLAGMYGSIFGDLESFLSNNQMLQAMFQHVQGISLVEQFISMLVCIMIIISIIPILTFILRVRSEEKQGHTEHLLGRCVPRIQQLLAYFIPAFACTLLMPLLTALGFWSVGSTVMEDIPALSVFLQAAYVYLPAVWVFMGLSMALIACLPERVSLVYVYLGYSFFAVYMGRIAGLPDWMAKLTPFGYIPQVPVDEISLLPLAALTAIALLLMGTGFWGYARRDYRP